MPIDHEIDRAAGVVTIVSKGDLTEDEMLGAVDRTLSDPKRVPGMHVVLDVSAQTTVPSAALIRRYAQRIAQSGMVTARTRYAMVAPRDAQFGMGRMFELVLGDLPAQIRVFRERSAALRWLREEPDADDEGTER